MECGSEAAALGAEPKAVADAIALQGALGTTIFKVATSDDRQATPSTLVIINMWDFHGDNAGSDPGGDGDYIQWLAS